MTSMVLMDGIQGVFQLGMEKKVTLLPLSDMFLAQRHKELLGLWEGSYNSYYGEVQRTLGIQTKVRGRKELSENQDGLPGGASVSWKAPGTASF